LGVNPPETLHDFAPNIGTIDWMNNKSLADYEKELLPEFYF
jgi:hypothetical protein